jgi:hypothetical protein
VGAFRPILDPRARPTIIFRRPSIAGGRQNRREKKPESDQARLYWLPEVLATPASPRIALLFSKQ